MIRNLLRPATMAGLLLCAGLAAAQWPIPRAWIYSHAAPGAESNVSSDDQIIATESSDGFLDVWNLTSHALMYDEYEGLFSSPPVISNDSTKLAILGANNQLYLFSVYSGAMQWVNVVGTQTSQLQSVAFSPNNQLIYFSGGQTFGAVTMDGRQVYATQSSGDYNKMAVSPNGTQAAAASGYSDNFVYLINTANGAQIAEMTGHTAPISGLAYSPSGNILYTCSQDGTIRQWNTSTGAAISKPFVLGQPINSIAINLTGNLIAVALANKTIETISATTGAVVSSVSSHDGYATGQVTFTPDGTKIVTSQFSSEYGIYQTSNLAYLAGLGIPDLALTGPAWSSNGNDVWTGSSFSGLLSEWSSNDLSEVSRTVGTDGVTSVVASANGTYTATGHSTQGVSLITNSTGVSTQLTSSEIGAINSLAFSSDSSTVVAGASGEARAWNTAGTMLGTMTHPSGTTVTAVATYGTGSNLVIATGDSAGNIYTWSGSTYKKIATLPVMPGQVVRLEYAQNGTTLLAAAVGTLTFYNATTGVVSRTVTLPVNTDISDFDVSPDGTTVCVGILTDSTGLQFYSLTNPSYFLYYETGGSVLGVRYSPSGNLIAMNLQSEFSSQVALVGNPAKTTPVALAPSPFGGPGGSVVDVRAYISAPAPSTGAILTVSSSNPYITVPAQVTVQPGDQFVDFAATLSPFVGVELSRITLVYGSNSVNTMLVKQPTIMTGLAVSAGDVVGGNSLTGTVLLNAPAPAGGVVVTLGSSSKSATVPASVTIPAGASSATFSITTKAVTTASEVTLTAGYRGFTQTTAFELLP